MGRLIDSDCDGSELGAAVVVICALEGGMGGLDGSVVY